MLRPLFPIRLSQNQVQSQPYKKMWQSVEHKHERLLRKFKFIAPNKSLLRYLNGWYKASTHKAAACIQQQHFQEM